MHNVLLSMLASVDVGHFSTYCLKYDMKNGLFPSCCHFRVLILGARLFDHVELIVMQQCIMGCFTEEQKQCRWSLLFYMVSKVQGTYNIYDIGKYIGQYYYWMSAHL